MKKYSRLDLESETENIVNEIKERFEKKGFSVVMMNDASQIRKLIDKNIPDDATVGLDGTSAIDELDIPIFLTEKWNVIIDPYQKKLAPEIREYLFAKMENVDHYITTIDALTKDGQVVFKNRNKFLTSQHNKGPENVIALADMGNIVQNLEDAKKKLNTEQITVLEVSPFGLRRGLVDNYGQMEEYHDDDTLKQNTFTIVLLAEEPVY